MNELVGAINGVIWSPALIFLCLGVGLYFSLRSRFLQLRHIKHMITLMFGGVLPMQAYRRFRRLR